MSTNHEQDSSEDEESQNPPVVKANTIDKFRGTYKPNEERVYYRNDGNQHIKSLGDKC